MKHLILTVAILAGIATAKASAAPPVVSNVRAAQIAGTKNVEILYDVSDADGDALTHRDAGERRCGCDLHHPGHGAERANRRGCRAGGEPAHRLECGRGLERAT